jgi:hypothetical protein
LKYRGEYGYTYFTPYICAKTDNDIKIVNVPNASDGEDLSAVEEFINP